MKKPSNNPTPLNADRLIEAAEGAFAAAARHAAEHDGRYTSPALLKSEDEATPELAAFTLEEVIDATAFLTRMGFLPSSHRAARS
ncbi:MAG: hypothetical protein R3B57_14645 [Phycisphaerales bacterium]